MPLRFLLCCAALGALLSPLGAQTDDPVVVQTREFTWRKSDIDHHRREKYGDSPEAREMAERQKSFYVYELLRHRVLLAHGRKLGLDREDDVRSLPESERDTVTVWRAEALLKKSFKVNEANLRARFADVKDQFEFVEIRHLLLAWKGLRHDQTGRSKEEAKEIAEEAYELIKSGEMTLEDAAEEGSDHRASAAKRGLLSFGRGVVDAALEKVAFSAPVGVLQRPFESSFGYHILRVERRSEEESYQRARAELEDVERTYLLDQWLEEQIKALKPKFAPGYDPLAR